MTKQKKLTHEDVEQEKVKKKKKDDPPTDVGTTLNISKEMQCMQTREKTSLIMVHER